DKELMLLSYLFVGQADKSLELDSNFDEVVIAYYEAVEQEKALKELVDYSDEIRFKVALLDEDYETVVDMIDEGIEVKEESEESVILAYLDLDLVKEAKEFAESTENTKSLKSMIE